MAVKIYAEKFLAGSFRFFGKKLTKNFSPLNSCGLVPIKMHGVSTCVAPRIDLAAALRLQSYPILLIFFLSTNHLKNPSAFCSSSLVNG